jgi:hypothetical protein
VTIVAVPITHWLVDDLSKKLRLTRTMLVMAIETIGSDRITLMGSHERGAVDFMTGRAKLFSRQKQQSRLICHMRIMAGATTIEDRSVHYSAIEILGFVTFITKRFRIGIKQFGDR